MNERRKTLGGITAFIDAVADQIRRAQTGETVKFGSGRLSTYDQARQRGSTQEGQNQDSQENRTPPQQ